MGREGARDQRRDVDLRQRYFDAIAQLEAGATFTGLSAHVIETVGEAAATEELAGWLGQWLADGVLVLGLD